MKLTLFTTETLHHSYFAQQLHSCFPIDSIIVEKKKLKPPFDVNHSFEAERALFEKTAFFNNKVIPLNEIAKVVTVNSINDQVVSDYLIREKPDVIIVFGTGKIKKHIIEGVESKIINLHGGNPEFYRGLDSHLWAIYHNDFSNIVTCLHRVNEQLDDGEVILQFPVPIKKGMKLYELQKSNTETCIKLVLTALDMYQRFGFFIGMKQKRKGRYYSFMPSNLKEVALKKFEKYTNVL